jgi:hypothetical protein
VYPSLFVFAANRFYFLACITFLTPFYAAACNINRKYREFQLGKSPISKNRTLVLEKGNKRLLLDLSPKMYIIYHVEGVFVLNIKSKINEGKNDK